MRISRDKVTLEMARKKMSRKALAEAYGVSQARIGCILNSREVNPVTAGRLAAVLGVDVTDILETS